MPTSYAHYKFGQEVKVKLPKDILAIVNDYPQLFDLGLHGPDLLFYYNALKKNKINTTGFGLHEYSGRYVFRRAAKVIIDKQMSHAHLAYIFGFLCHYSLDVSCHGCVNAFEATGIASHLEIEAELDREMLVRDGKDPLSTILTKHLVSNRENAEVIKDFFPGITAKEIEKTIKDMIFYLNFLVAPGKFKRWIFAKGLKLVGKYEDFGGLMINVEKNHECDKTVERLLDLYEDAKGLAVQLIQEYPLYLNKELELNEVYKYSFDSELPRVGRE
ncbi:MAG: zinc dependent phospholipase C family protein [Lachnospiraceae bacterium]|nr:zinc dependent phospholipase C family protein [Lachnospiraceae bacterium]